MGATLLVFGVFAFLYRTDGEEYVRLWAMAFGLSSIRQSFALASAMGVESSLVDMGVRVCAVLSGLLLMGGTYSFLERRFPRPWLAAAVIVGGWIVIVPFLDVSFLVATVPVFLFRGATDIITGVVLLRGRRTGGALLAGVAFVVWGLHRFDYPFLRPIEWVAPWGFGLAALLALMVAFGVLMMHYEKVRADRERSQRRYRSMFESALDGFLRTNMEGNILAANPALVDMLGYDSEEALKNVNMSEIYAAPETRERLLEEFEDQDIVDGLELQWLRKDSQLISVVIRMRRLADERTVFEGTVRDVTEEKVMRAQLDLARRMEALGRLAGGVAHDFNNYLTAILTGVEMAQLELEDGNDPTGDLEAVRVSAEQAADVCRRLLSFSRHDVEEPTPIAFDTALANAETMLRRLIPKDIELHVDAAAEGAHVLVEPGQLERVIINLAVNGQQAMPNGGRLDIESIVDDRDSVLLLVRDEGVGMDPEVASRIFDPFFTTKEAADGVGLGLSTVFQLVRSLNGEIEVDSERGRGTEFRLRIPTCDREEAKNVSSRQETPEASESDLVLLVEDEPVVRRLMTRALDRAGFDVLVATDGDEALRCLEERLHDLSIIVSDVVMPGRSVSELRDLVAAKRPDLPFLLVSGYAADELQHRGISEQEFLAKPFTGEELMRKIRLMLSSGATAPGSSSD